MQKFSNGIDIAFRDVTKRYGSVTAVSGMNLDIPRGGFVALLGPSGCGKTTCLRMIGGFEQPSEGRLAIRGNDVTGVPPHRRPVNMVFQHYALFPHLDVFANIAYGLRQLRPKVAGAEITRRVGEAMEMVRLGGYGSRRIHELSGGQQQRVALARALVNRPAVLLLDEPLAALDRKLRVAMQIELQTLQRDLGITFLLVTHDQEEALSMSDLVCVMNGGRVVQFATPREIYDRPATPFVADFVGKTNMLAGEVLSVETDGSLRLKLADGSLLEAGGDIAAPGPATVSIRPEAIGLSRSGTGSPAVVTNRIFLGSTAEYAVHAAGLGDLLVAADHRAGATDDLLEPGEQVKLTFRPGAARAFTGQQTGTA